MSYFSNRLIYIVALIIAIIPLSVFSMEDEKLKESVTHDFNQYIDNSRLPPVYLLNRIQSEDFEGKNFTFHFDKQDGYLNWLATHPFLSRPTEKPKVIEVTTGNSSVIKVECMVHDKSPSSPLVKLNMTFNYKRKS